ncbi:MULTISPECIES: response regulator transcription factor [Actinoalloteichus]|uniref:Two component transcriptional regulator, LuxR family n=1 Tax=Actinoalloteichus fjordicus TaxID=1612552 RepID=A0AAC9LDZ1_9PSEU|nr:MULTISPECIES: response regulator transcription factor [Actinoalloteichus]APU15105.1 two component transcriptional regulator, LuxR family [Actinoalloteichus fjordicus]APU21173.1 two component transcriptional regulator, LuxR family [Actinoalloteichus sp. GBA129-24]
MTDAVSDTEALPIRVFLADDDDRFRGAYRKLFDRTAGYRVAGEAADGTQAARRILALAPDVALLDVQMPGGGGLAAARCVLEASDRIRVIMLTTFDLDEYVHEALTLGAAGFLLKNAAPPEVLHAVRTVHAGNAMLAPEVTARLMRRFAPPRPPRRHAFADHTLSEREVQVIRLVARGYSNQRIADELFLSIETVRTYLRRMFAKLDVNDRTHLAVLAYEAGLLHEPR